MKALYALVFVLFSFAAPAQTLETSIAAYYLYDDDCLGETTRQSTMPAQMIAIELLCAAIFDEVDDAIAKPDNAEDVPAGAIHPSDENSTVKHSTARDDRLKVDDTMEQPAMGAQIVETEPTVEKLGKSVLNEEDDVAITGPNNAEDIPVGGIQPSNENSTVPGTDKANGG
jgi:hypothetical protein